MPGDAEAVCEAVKSCPLKTLSTSYLRVCAKHFTDQMFVNDLHNRLKPHAMPVANVLADTVILQSVPMSSSQIQQVSHSISLNVDEICGTKLVNMDHMAVR